MESAIAVANYFVQKAQADGVNITPMQLVKLVYISHGWHLGLTEEPLLGDTVQAWKYGPVIPSVYHAFKVNGNAPIESVAYEPSGFGHGTTYRITKDPNVIPLLDKVWEIYGTISGAQLSTMTHMEGTPWYITWHQKGGNAIQGTPIPNNLIKDLYLRKVAANSFEPQH